MDWTSLTLSLKLAAATVLILLPLGIWLGQTLAWRNFRGKAIVEAVLALPLVLPPTVLGYYLLVLMGHDAVLGRWYAAVFGQPLAFSFSGILIASVIFNLPFAILPIQRAFEAISPEIREAALCCGMSSTRILRRIALPLAWPGIVSAMVLSFAHTLGEFGVVLMVGGSIPGETRTIAISIYDKMQSFDTTTAGLSSAVLLFISLMAISFAYLVSKHAWRREK